MRRAPAWVVVVGVVVGWGGLPAPARATEGFWVTLAAGAGGASAPSDYSEFWFDSPHAPPVAVNQLNGTFTAQASTAGGSTFFSGIGTPVLLPTGDGYATLSQSGSPFGSGGLPKFAGGTQASGAPQTGVPLGSANLLSVGLGSQPPGGQVLTVGMTDANGHPLGSGHVGVPDGGWWVIGLGAGTKDTGNPTPDPGTGGAGGTGGTTPPPVPPPGPSTGPVATPEPATLVLLGVGGLAAAGYRRLRREA